MRDFSDKTGQVVTVSAQTVFSLLTIYKLSKRGKVVFFPPLSLEIRSEGKPSCLILFLTLNNEHTRDE